MDEELKSWLGGKLDGLGGKFAAIDERLAALDGKLDGKFAAIDERFAALDDRLELKFAEMEARFAAIDEKFAELESRLTWKMDRAAEAFAGEIGKLHIQIQDLDRRLRRVDGNTITTMELLTRQSRWHEESDNAIRDFATGQTDLARKVEELRVRIEKLERAS
jgi:chromosome segregation ATPase